jgi:hypothetical protein
MIRWCRLPDFRPVRPRRVLPVLILLISAVMEATSAPPPPADEMTLKAVFLERFCRFVQWPDDTVFTDTTQPFSIAVLDDPAMERVIARIYRTVRIRGCRVATVRATADSIPPCRMLYLGPGASTRLSPILSALNGHPVLTVGNAPGFARRGTHINLYTNQDLQVRFEVNNVALVKSGLRMSHLLLGLARVVDPAREEP